MTDSETNLADELLKAIRAERDGHTFYKMAADSSKDPKAKEVFALLAQEEFSHMEFLTQHYESLLKTGKLNQSAELGKRLDLSGSFPIFSEGIKGRLREAHVEMSALSIGIRLELDAMKFYKSRAETADDPGARGFFYELAEWEAGHYQALLRQQDGLKEDYWTASGFAPF